MGRDAYKIPDFQFLLETSGSFAPVGFSEGQQFAMALLPCWVRLSSWIRTSSAYFLTCTSLLIHEGTGKPCTQLLCGRGCIVHFLWSFQLSEEAESVNVWCNFSKTEQLRCLELGLEAFYSSEFPAHIFCLLNTRISFSSWKPSPFSLCNLGEADPVGLRLRTVHRKFCLSRA